MKRSAARPALQLDVLPVVQGAVWRASVVQRAVQPKSSYRDHMLSAVLIAGCFRSSLRSSGPCSNFDAGELFYEIFLRHCGELGSLLLERGIRSILRLCGWMQTWLHCCLVMCPVKCIAVCTVGCEQLADQLAVICTMYSGYYFFPGFRTSPISNLNLFRHRLDQRDSQVAR
jgi:hypothetical protein